MSPGRKCFRGRHGGGTRSAGSRVCSLVGLGQCMRLWRRHSRHEADVPLLQRCSRALPGQCWVLSETRGLWVPGHLMGSRAAPLTPGPVSAVCTQDQSGCGSTAGPALSSHSPVVLSRQREFPPLTDETSKLKVTCTIYTTTAQQGARI